MIFKNKKANMEDTFWIVAVLFGAAIFFIILSYTWTQISPRINTGLSGAMPDDGINITTTLNRTDTAITRYNTVFPLIIIGLFAFVLISAFFMNSHPAFFFVGLLLLGIALIFGAIFSNVYHQIADHEELESTTDRFGTMDLFMKNLPLFTLVIFAVIGMVLWSKFGGGGSATGGI